MHSIPTLETKITKAPIAGKRNRVCVTVLARRKNPLRGLGGPKHYQYTRSIRFFDSAKAAGGLAR